MHSSIIFLFIVLSLAVWRVTHLFVKEDGPFNIIFRIRKAAGAGFFGSLLDCFYCCSIWIAIPAALWIGNTIIEKIIYWFALSGAACLLEQGTNKNKTENDIPIYKED